MNSEHMLFVLFLEQAYVTRNCLSCIWNLLLFSAVAGNSFIIHGSGCLSGYCHYLWGLSIRIFLIFLVSVFFGNCETFLTSHAVEI